MQTTSGPNSTLTQSVKPENSSKAFLDRILSSENTIKVIRETPSTSLLLLIKEVGLDDCHELVELMSASQIQEHLDLDVWVGDRINFRTFGTWLQALFAANPRKAIQQMHGLDFDLLCFLFKSHSSIFDTEEGEEPEGDLDLHTITPGLRYIVAFYEEESHESNGIGHCLKKYLESLYERDLRFVYLLMEAVRHETSSSLEESAYDFRRSRLADMGFPELTEALSIFAYLDPDQASEQTEFVPYSLPQVAISNFMLQVTPHNSSMTNAMQSLDVNVRLQVEHALIYLVNQVFVVRNGGNFDLETMKKCGEFAMATLGLGLRYLSQDRPEHYGLWLAKLAPQQIFRTGFSLIIKLQRQWRGIVRKLELTSESIAALDFPLKEAVDGINRRVPAFFCNLSETTSAAYKSFSDLNEVALTARALSHSAFRASLLGTAGLNIDFKAHPTACHGVFFASYLCQHLIGSGGVVSLQKWTPIMLNDLFNRMEKNGDMRRLSVADRKSAHEIAKKLAASIQPLWPSQELSELESKAVGYADIALGSVESEFTRLSHAPERQFVTALL